MSAKPRGDVLRTLAVIAAAASVILTVAAFWLSYAHLHEVSEGHGLGGSPERAWAWPATLDLFIVIGEVLWLRASLQRRTDWWAISLTVVGSGGSIALNIAGVGAHSSALNYVVAAVPPSAALVAFGALMRQLHGALAARIESAPVRLPVVEAEAPQGVPASAPEALPALPAERPEPVIESIPEAPPVAAPERPKARPRSAPKPAAKAPRKASAKRPQSATRADAKATIEALYDTKQGRPLEGDMTAALAALQGYPHTSRQHANKLRAEIERERPDLAALGSGNVFALTGS